MPIKRVKSLSIANQDQFSENSESSVKSQKTWLRLSIQKIIIYLTIILFIADVIIEVWINLNEAFINDRELVKNCLLKFVNEGCSVLAPNMSC
jgi:hypothetical protein